MQTPQKLSENSLYPAPHIVLNGDMNSALTENAVQEEAGSAPGTASFEDMLSAVGRNQDRKAFIDLFEYFAPRIKSFMLKSGAAPDQADELAQETMLTVWNKAGSYNPKLAGASTWIFTIARNKRIDGLRKQNRPEPDPDDPLMVRDDLPVPGEHLSRSEETHILSEAMKDLPEEQAELIRKSFFEDKTHQAIADETKLPLGTVKSRIRLALDRLRSDQKVKELWT